MTRKNFKIKKWPIIGHKNNIKSLQNNIKGNLISHAYLFVGPDYIGKSLIAKYFAKTILCEKQNRPCDLCSNCELVDNSSDSDFMYIDGKSEKIKIDQIRALQHNLSLKSNKKFKINIIDGVDNFTVEAANAILKYLEEPKGQVIFILIAKSLENVLPTIISRCISYRFGLVDKEEIKKWLHVNFNSDNIENFANLSLGRPGMAYELVNNFEFNQEIKETEKDIENIIDSNLSKSFKIISEWVCYEECQLDKLDILSQWMRDLYLYKVRNSEDIVQKQNIDKAYPKYSKNYSLDKIKDILENIVRSKEMLMNNVNRKLVLENIALNMKYE